MRLHLIGHPAEGLLGNTPGGGTSRLAFLAPPLGRRGNRVTLVVPGSGGKEGRLEGVELRSGWYDGRGVPFLRAATYRYPRLQGALVDTRAEAHHIRGVSRACPTRVSAARASEGLLSAWRRPNMFGGAASRGSSRLSANRVASVALALPSQVCLDIRNGVGVHELRAVLLRSSARAGVAEACAA